MIVNLVECIDGAKRAKGLVVIVDVFRSTTLGCYLADKGVGEYFVAETLEQAKEIGARKGGIIIGEKKGVPVEEFDLNNSPVAIEDEELEGKTLVHTTNSGTPGLFACTEADEIITGSFVNAGAVVRYIQSREPEVVTLVAMGTGGEIRAQEDMMCAMYIKNELEDYPNSFKTLKKFLAQVDSSEKFFDATREDAPEKDFEMCMELDRFDFVLQAESLDDGSIRMKKVRVEPV